MLCECSTLSEEEIGSVDALTKMYYINKIVRVVNSACSINSACINNACSVSIECV